MPLLRLPDVDLLGAGDRAALGVAAGGAQNAPGDGAVHGHASGAEDEVAADPGSPVDGGLAGPHQEVLANLGLSLDGGLAGEWHGR